MKRFLFVISAISFIYFLSGCDSTKTPATGLEDEIYVVADSLEYEDVKLALQSTFEIEINTPLPEKLFTLKRVSPNQIDKVKKENILIVAPLNSGSYTSKYINSIIDTAVRNKLEKDDNFILSKYDLWAKGQLVTILSTANMQELEFKILKIKTIFYMLIKKFPTIDLRKVFMLRVMNVKPLKANYSVIMAG
jgi:hypothetical protein